MGEFVFSPDRVEPALTVMDARYAAVAERVHEIYGLRLPRHMAVFAAFLDCLGRDGARALHEGVGVGPAGITRYFDADGLALTGRDGLDERLEDRFRRDPAEFVTVMWGDTDGLHFGLWYDDPAEPPSFVAYNYARDDAHTWSDGAVTPLAQIAARIQTIERDIADDPGHEYGGGPERAELRRALDAFAAADQAACRLDGRSRWTDVPRHDILGGLGPALPDDAGDPRTSQKRARDYRDRSPRVREWIAEAAAELAAGKPAYALVLGRELHWLDADDYREDALRLLTGAYQALGRDALASIAAVHHAHRDLRSVAVLTRTPLAD